MAVDTTTYLPNIKGVAKHTIGLHTEADEVRISYSTYGAFDVWREPDGVTYHCLVRLPDGSTGDRIITKASWGEWIEKTAFRPKGGNLRYILDWLARKGATRFTQPLP